MSAPRNNHLYLGAQWFCALLRWPQCTKRVKGLRLLHGTTEVFTVLDIVLDNCKQITLAWKSLLASQRWWPSLVNWLLFMFFIIIIIYTPERLCLLLQQILERNNMTTSASLLEEGKWKKEVWRENRGSFWAMSALGLGWRHWIRARSRIPRESKEDRLRASDVPQSQMDPPCLPGLSSLPRPRERTRFNSIIRVLT